MFGVDEDNYLFNKKAKIPCISDDSITSFANDECDISRKFVMFKRM